VPGKFKISKLGTKYRSNVQLSTASKNYHALVKKYCLIQKTQYFECPLKVFMLVQPPLKKRAYDIDNYCKVVFDSLQHAGIYKNDSQIKELTIKFGQKEKDGAIKIHLAEITHDD
jgi:Holliday junction resolvase RusA-like endonuclease